MKNRIIEICELGQPQSIIHRENEPISELIKTEFLIKELNEAINYTRCYVSEAEQFFCWDKKGKLSKQCESQCNVCFRYERNNKKNCT